MVMEVMVQELAREVLVQEELVAKEELAVPPFPQDMPADPSRQEKVRPPSAKTLQR